MSSMTVQRLLVIPAAMAGVVLRYCLGRCLPFRQRRVASPAAIAPKIDKY
jgi:hypothetical protein